MTLSDYMKPLTKPELDDFAARCDTTAGHLKQVAGGHRRCGEDLAINIERESNRAVLCETLRDDVDWQFIRSTGAPKNGQTTKSTTNPEAA